MKPRDIQRGIVSRHTRKEGDAPDIGRVSKLRSNDLDRGRRSRRRGSIQDPSRIRALKIWSIWLGVGAVLVICAAFFLWIKPLLSRAAAKDLNNALDDAAVRIVSKFPSPSSEEAISIVKKALLNRDPAFVSDYFRMGSASPQEIVDYCAKADERDGVLGELLWLSSVDTDGLLLEGVLVAYEGNEKSVQRLALLSPDAKGHWKLDFDAFARTVKPSWDKVLEKQALRGLVRVLIAPDVYYNGPFSDESKWVCYALNSPDLKGLLRAYCRAGTPLADSVAKIFEDGRQLSRVTLEINRIPDSEKSQFEITRLLATDWVLPEEAIK